MLADRALELLVASPLHLLLLLVVLAVIAFRAPRGRTLRYWRYPLLLLIAWTWASTTPAIAHALLVQLESAYPPPLRVQMPEASTPVILVLGAGYAFDASNPDELQLNLAGMRRTLAGAGLWHEVGGELLLLGSVRNERVPVATRMASLAEAAGVEREATRVLPDSFNTYQNLTELPHEELRDRPVFLVTSAWHMPRAMAVAHALGMKVIPVACDYRGKRDLTWRAWLPANGGWPMTHLALHEFVGLAYYRWRGWI